MGTWVAFGSLQLISKALNYEKGHLVRKGVAAQPLLLAQQPSLPPAGARGGEGVSSFPTRSHQEAPRPSTSDLDSQEGGQTGTLLASHVGAGASRPRYGAGFGPRLQLRATWPQRYGFIVPPAVGRS